MAVEAGESVSRWDRQPRLTADDDAEREAGIGAVLAVVLHEATSADSPGHHQRASSFLHFTRLEGTDGSVART